MVDVQINDAEIARIPGLQGVQNHLDTVADRVAAAARTSAARHVGNGSYLRSIKVVRAAPDGHGRLVVSEDEQAAAVEFGVRPHIIRAAPGQALWWAGAAHPVRQVNHPGSPAFHVLGNAADAARGG
ncbi:hypothetical protein [Actinomadura sp. 3N508]|uniref:hypothetical protein n=1 Tax=Actinomadura sp. 3N508 TaxID=3375153 RepID=UPI0037B51E37